MKIHPGEMVKKKKSNRRSEVILILQYLTNRIPQSGQLINELFLECVWLLPCLEALAKAEGSSKNGSKKL